MFSQYSACTLTLTLAPTLLHLALQIHTVLMFSRQGKPRLQKWYDATSQVWEGGCVNTHLRTLSYSLAPLPLQPANE